MKRKLLVPIVVLVVGMLAAACAGSDSDNSGASSSDGKLGHEPVNVRIGGDWPTLNVYQTAANINADIIATAVFDRLVDLAPDGKTVVPYLASEWDVTPTKLSFTIKDGVTCSDGTPLDAAAIAGALDYLVTESYVTLLFGAGPYEISHTDDTVTVELGTPFSDALYNLTDPHASIVCPKQIDLWKAENSTETVGSGPYVMTEAIHSDRVELEAREGYNWGANGLNTDTDGFPSAMTIHVVTEESTAANMLLTGELDVASMTGPDVDRLLEEDSLSHSTYGGQYLSNIVFNPSVEAMNDQAVRRAISQAIDTEEFMVADTGGYGVTSPSFFAPEATCFDPTVADVVAPKGADEAKATLEAAGYVLEDGVYAKDGSSLEFEMVTTTQNFSAAGQEYIARSLADAGIKININSVDAATYNQLLVAGTYDIAQQLLSGGGPAPGNYILYMTGPGFADGGGNTSINNPEVNELVQAALSADPETQCEAWSKVQHAVIEANDVLPLDQQQKQYFTNGYDLIASTMLHLNNITKAAS